MISEEVGEGAAASVAVAPPEAEQEAGERGSGIWVVVGRES